MITLFLLICLVALIANIDEVNSEDSGVYAVITGLVIVAFVYSLIGFIMEI